MAIAVSFLCFNLASYNYYPASWCDEVTYSEPGVNLAQGRGLTTQIWQFQPANSFWAVNPPLYPVLLAGWMKAFGTSLLAARAFNVTAFSGVLLLLWRVSWAFGIVTLPWARIAILLAAGCGYGMALAYRSARPDVLPMLALLLLLSSLQLRQRHLRHAVSGLIALSIPFMGLQVALYAAVAGVLAWAVARLISWRDLAAICMGLAAGGCLLLGVLAWFDAIAHFQASVQAASHAGGLQRMKAVVPAYAKDFSAIPLIVLAVILAWRVWPNIRGTNARLLALLGSIYLLVPGLFCLLADFRSYYAYMIFVPLLLGVGRLISLTWNHGGRLKALIAASLLVSIALGLPLRIAATVILADLMPRKQIERRVAEGINAKDIVYTDYMTFFEIKAISPNVFVPFSAKGLGSIEGNGRDLTADERASVTVLCARPESLAAVTNYFAGNWRAVSEPFGDHLKHPAWIPEKVYQKLARHLFERAPTARYKVQLLRRQSAGIPGE